jgi:signal transduction histidine kinase
VLFFTIGGIVYYWIYEFYINSSKEALLQNIELISFELENDKDPDELAQKIKNNLNIRLTIIDENGGIVAESHKDKSKMDNHKYRDEILQSNTQDYGFKVRHSKTIDKNMLYIAKKYTINGKTIYIRLSRELKGIQEHILVLGMKIFAVLVLFFIALTIVTYKINAQIQYETNKIVKFLKSLTKKNKSTYINSDYSQEFALITNLLTKVSQIIVKKEKQKSKYTQRLQESNKQKDDIISAISHEFKNPIAVVNGYSQTLLDDEDLNPNIRKKFLTKIHKNGTKLSELIDTLRLSIKLDSGQQALKTKNINLYELVKECAENIKLSYPSRETIITGRKDTLIQVDETLFSIVISNLIENAFKYSEDEIIINITTNTLEVIDTGIGISENDLQNITNKFYRVHKNSWNNSLGLGLFLVNNITKLHNFKLEIKSKENEGSTFSIRF